MRAGSSSRLLGRGRLLGFAVVGALGSAVIAAPGALAATGGGTASGGSKISPGNPVITRNGPCVPVNALNFTETAPTARYAVTVSGTTYAYAGPVTLTMSLVNAPAYTGPTGTFGYDPTCGVAPGTPFNMTGSVTGSADASGATLSCMYDSGTFSRVNPPGGNGTATGVAKLTGSCDITVGGHTYRSPTNEVRTLAYTGCNPPAGGPPTSCTDNDAFTASDAGPGRELGDSRGQPRLSSGVTKRRHGVKTTFHTTGRLSLPGGFGRSACRGTISVQIKHGTRTVSRRRIALKQNCTFSQSTSVLNSRLRGRGQNQILVRYQGTGLLKPASATRRFA